jgi:hypothetical protein
MIGSGLAVGTFALQQGGVILPASVVHVLGFIGLSAIAVGGLLAVPRLPARYGAPGGILIGTISWLGVWYFLIAAHSLVENGGFEHKLVAWTWSTAPGVDSTAEVDSTVSCEGSSSLKLAHSTPLRRDAVGVLRQDVRGLRPGQDYTLAFWVKSRRADAGALFLSVDSMWAERVDVPIGEYDWLKRVKVFNTGPAKVFELRIVAQAPGTVWIDGIALYKGDLRAKKLGRERCPD